MTTQDLDKRIDDTIPPKIKPLPPAPPPGKGSGPGALRWLGPLALLAACAGAVAIWRLLHPVIPPPEPGPLLRIHGSNTIGEKLMPALVTAFMASEHYTHLQVEPGDGPNETYVLGQRRDGARRVEISAAGSETGFADLAAGRADISMSSEPINAAHLRELQKLGDLSTPAGEHVIGLDGVAVIVHPLNPVSDLTLQQLADIFSGRLTDWAQLGGPPGVINLYARNDDSGTWATFRQTVLQAFGEHLSAAAKLFDSSPGLSDAVAQDTRGIGFIGTAYAGTNKALGLSEQGVEPRRPAPCTLKTEEYVLSRRLYLYTATRMPAEVSHFIQYVTSKAAWPVVNDAGFVNLDPAPVASCDNPAHSRHSPEYLRATQHAQRLLTNFDFRPRSLELDSKAYLSIGYLSDLLSSGAYRGHKLLLIGHADEAVSAAENRMRSLQEANAVREQLAARLRRDGVKVQLDLPRGLGAQELLAPHETPAGREKNRRVEVWLH